MTRRGFGGNGALDKVRKAQRVQVQFGQVRDDVDIVAVSFAITVSLSLRVGWRAVMGVFCVLQR